MFYFLQSLSVYLNNRAAQPVLGHTVCLRIPRQLIVLKHCLMPAAPSSYSPFGVTIPTGQMVDPSALRHCSITSSFSYSHRLGLSTDCFSWRESSPGMEYNKHLQHHCHLSFQSHTSLLQLSSLDASARSASHGAGSSKAALAPTRNVAAPDNPWR